MSVPSFPWSPLRFVAHAGAGSGTGPVVALRMIDGRLYSSAQFDGALHLWDIEGGLAQVDTAAHFRGLWPGVTPDLGLVPGTDGTPALLTGGGAAGALRLIDLGAGGGFGRNAALGVIPDWAGDLTHSVTVEIGPAQRVYGALAGASGLGWLRFEAGVLVGRGVVPDTLLTHAEDAQGLASVVVEGQRFVVSLGGHDPGLTAWRVTPEGLEPADNLEVDEGLWISAPSALASATIGDRAFVVVAAAGSGSLSVVEVVQTAELVVVDHVLDDRSTRFGGVEALAIVTHQGQPWVIAGGADDGVSVFRMLPGGRLLAQAHMAQDAQARLGDVSALAARSEGDGIDIYVGSFLESGVTALRLETGRAGVQLSGPDGGGALTGTAGADVLIGGAATDYISGGFGADVLVDGAGRDTMTGGVGPDTFVLSADGVLDVIADFERGMDRLDLSGWALLRDVTQLTLTSRADGIDIRYGDERLLLRSADGRAIDPDSLSTGDVLATLRIAPVAYVSAEVPPLGADLFGTGAADQLQASDLGQQIFGLAGDDQLLGGTGRDWLFGGDGRDLLDGGGGRNRLDGGLGNDSYVLRSDLDQISGEVGFAAGGGIDTARVWMDYTLPANVEILRLQGEADLNGYGNAAPEVLVGNAGANLLSGGWGEDRIVGKAGDDVIIGGPRPDELVGGIGADTFVYATVTDSRAGRGARDFINGFDRGADRIDLSLIDANSRTAENDTFRFIGARDFSGLGRESAGELNYARYGGNWNIISGDVDGDGSADFQIFVNLTHWMTGSDFIL